MYVELYLFDAIWDSDDKFTAASLQNSYFMLKLQIQHFLYFSGHRLKPSFQKILLLDGHFIALLQMDINGKIRQIATRMLVILKMNYFCF